MKRIMIWGAVVISAALAIGAVYPESGSVAADKPTLLAQAETVSPAPRQAQAEASRGLLDCQRYAQSMQAQGGAKAKMESTFRRQFGKALDASGTYRYDKYTRIMLSCAGETCTISCASDYQQ